MPVILAPDRAPSVQELLADIAEAKTLVDRIEPGLVYAQDTKVLGIGPIGSANEHEISFIVSSKFKDQLQQASACAVIMTADMRAELAKTPDYVQVICGQPYLLYALVARWFDQRRQPPWIPGVHPSAVVHQTASIDKDAVIGPNVVVGAGTVIDQGVMVQANCCIGANCRIGSGSVLYPNVTFYDNVRIGQRGIIHAGVVLGADGFGFAPNPMLGQGAWGKISQLGGVVVGNDVEIGANTTIDRGALEDTVIGNGVKLDNQIMIGHNCHIGDHTAMAACVGIAGSTKIGARCIIGGAAMFSGHLTIADDVQISGGTAITSDIPKAGRFTGVMPAAPHKQWQRNAAVMSQLSELRKRLRELERNVGEIE
ncbi:MAG: UDP-3-O-(3-hydroxymyristoyl)glucosamine N-acyltransferase [Burkholderiaceae bacterium]|nr:UDP-3-O-(3-hydroxymyristoyl)glucosamine N-acyltransferase [Burkholderiaceae bacterium]MCD8518013.1 UDP-3-O-(3-hydroxymyristoyl)glucosamine N-acyltransferase [Burkholderiaceae bacterium]MCD8537340.1 UDP-3-O-(3-hydroxymyristoyl)glucosamine N-acyltransferase [Burkholderiaceae bacterium]MCD8564337.1 UDP-3-O-(3-hydroxymyristoyl)glucosamine N-acyltransferase [Burkholderiaceae bacterium]